jgi:transcription-repair coupling factor (superfamily II helicase)
VCWPAVRRAEDRRRPEADERDLSRQSPIDPRRIIELVQKNRAVKLAGNDKLRIDREIASPADRAHYLRDLLRSLGQPLKDPS